MARKSTRSRKTGVPIVVDLPLANILHCLRTRTAGSLQLRFNINPTDLVTAAKSGKKKKGCTYFCEEWECRPPDSSGGTVRCTCKSGYYVCE